MNIAAALRWLAEFNFFVHTEKNIGVRWLADELAAAEHALIISAKKWGAANNAKVKLRVYYCHTIFMNTNYKRAQDLKVGKSLSGAK